MCETSRPDAEVINLSEPGAIEHIHGIQVIDAGGLVLGGLIVVSPKVSDTELDTALHAAGRCLAALAHALDTGPAHAWRLKEAS
jgi:hypothetical protein